VGNRGLVRVLEKTGFRYLLSLSFALWDGLGLGTVALALALALIVFGLGLECSGLVNITAKCSAARPMKFLSLEFLH